MMPGAGGPEDLGRGLGLCLDAAVGSVRETSGQMDKVALVRAPVDPGAGAAQNWEASDGSRLGKPARRTLGVPATAPDAVCALPQVTVPTKGGATATVVSGTNPPVRADDYVLDVFERRS